MLLYPRTAEPAVITRGAIRRKQTWARTVRNGKNTGRHRPAKSPSAASHRIGSTCSADRNCSFPTPVIGSAELEVHPELVDCPFMISIGSSSYCRLRSSLRVSQSNGPSGTPPLPAGPLAALEVSATLRRYLHAAE